MKWWVYIVRCKDDTLYTGATNDLSKRIITHNSGEGAKYTRGRRPVKLLVQFECANKSEALRLEARIKRMTRQQKLDYIEKQ